MMCTTHLLEAIFPEGGLDRKLQSRVNSCKEKQQRSVVERKRGQWVKTLKRLACERLMQFCPHQESGYCVLLKM